MWTESNGIIGVGYEGKDISEFLSELKTWNVSLVVDVRLNPVSRKKGFSKRALTQALADVGIEYSHMATLGNPKENREGFSAPGTDAAKKAAGKYMTILEQPEQLQAIQALADVAMERHVAVLCFEASERCCHRQVVLQQVKELLQTASV